MKQHVKLFEQFTKARRINESNYDLTNRIGMGAITGVLFNPNNMTVSIEIDQGGWDSGSEMKRAVRLAASFDNDFLIAPLEEVLSEVGLELDYEEGEITHSGIDFNVVVSDKKLAKKNFPSIKI